MRNKKPPHSIGSLIREAMARLPQDCGALFVVTCLVADSDLPHREQAEILGILVDREACRWIPKESTLNPTPSPDPDQAPPTRRTGER
jgi:hypothetical protein